MRTLLIFIIPFYTTLTTIDVDFKTIEKGIDYFIFKLKDYSEYDGELHILRLNTKSIKPEVFISSQYNLKPMTTSEWCNKFKLNIAINLGMYHKDFSTHVGYLKNGDYINNPKFNEYKSALLLNPTVKNLPYAMIIDLDKPEEFELINKYKTIVQNLRLIKGNRINVWKKKGQSWPEAGVGIDKNKNLIIFFTETPIVMYDLIEILLKLPIHIEKAYHTDGGPPASLSIRLKDFSLDLSGNLATKEQEPIPNILGFRLIE